MLDVKNPEIRVDEIMQRIQEKVRNRREVTVSTPPAAPPAAPVAAPLPSSTAILEHITRAREFADAGATVPPMSTIHGLKRSAAQVMAKAFVRMAQLVTRDQRSYNNAIINALQAVVERGAQQDALTQHGQAVLARLSDGLAAEMRAREEVAAAVQRDRAEIATVAKQRGEEAQRLSRRLDALEEKIGAAVDQLTQARQALAEQIGQNRVSIALQERRLTMLLEEVKRRLPQPLDRAQLEGVAKELERVPDGAYLHFEDAFRGSREDIKRRVAEYLPRLRSSAPILDLGCGRGELLEVLRAAGLNARGVDSNRVAIEECRKLQLDATEGDLFDALAKTPDATLGAVTALHVVEHLPFPLQVKLIEESLRVVRPGGVVIFETPNPRNLLVGATNFYVDPTHQNPVHPQTLHYLFEARGLVQVETLPLHPFPKEMRLAETDSGAAKIINEYFFGPQDYAVVGRRP